MAKAGTDKIAATLIPGDGIGPEVVAATAEVWTGLGAPVPWEAQQAGMPGVAQDGASLPDWTERDRLHAARCRWLLTVLYLGGLRAAEVASTRMGAFLPA